MTAVGVLFDMDGVLVDSAHLHLRAYERVFRESGHELTDAARQAVLEGKPRSTVLDLALPGASEEVRSRLFEAKPIALREVLEEHGDCGMPGAKTTVEELFAAGIPMAVVTNSRAPEIWLAKMEIASLIQVVVTGADVTSPKPSPEGFLLGARRLGVDPSRCLAIEDSRDGCLAATRAGMRVALLAPERPPWLNADSAVFDRLDAARIRRRLGLSSEAPR